MRVEGGGKIRTEIGGKIRAETSQGTPAVPTETVGYRPRQSAKCPNCDSRRTRMGSGGATTKATATSDSIVRYFDCNECNHRWRASVPLD